MRAQPAELTDAVAGVSTLDLGGGLGITDTAQDDLLLLPALAVRLRSIMDDYCRAAGLPPLGGPGTVTLYEMGTIKDVTAVGDGANRLMLRRETVADLLSLETESEVR